MRRREFISLLGGAAAAWPPAADAQQPSKLPTIGFVGSGTPSTYAPWVAAFVQRLHELGWIKDRTVAIEVRWAEGRRERYAEIAVEFIRLKIDAILAIGTPATLAAKQATSVVPIVFVAVNDPVALGVVGSLARPDGNVTGLSNQQHDVVGKRLELLREVVPAFHRLAILWNPLNTGGVLEMKDVQTAASTMGLDIIPLEIRLAEEIEPALESLNNRVDALYLASDPLFNSNRIRINTVVVRLRLPTVYTFREYVEAGGLVSYGANFPALFRRGADFVDKILRGTKPADIPVEQPTKFDLVINLTTAKTLGLMIPDKLLALADEVIE
jgi:putative tryptophan/tyrosine transport system substrate-binding protein